METGNNKSYEIPVIPNGLSHIKMPRFKTSYTAEKDGAPILESEADALMTQFLESIQQQGARVVGTHTVEVRIDELQGKFGGMYDNATKEVTYVIVEK